MRILHFADAHIDIASQRRRDPESGLPIRVLDFLKALDAIIDAAITEKVDLVLFAGDAYKDRTPVPTYQREWGRRIIRLSQAGIPTLLLIGNHDLPPATGRANALQEFDTLEVPHIKVLAKPAFLKPDDLEGLPLQVIALPWVSRSGMLATLAGNGESAVSNVYEELETRINTLVNHWLDTADPAYPVLLTAHGMVQGAELGSERTISLGSDLTFPGSLVKDPRLAYTALGHIHKYQDLNAGNQPPVVYSGSIERVDFGEVQDTKGYVIATIEPGKPTHIERRVLNGRRFIDKFVQLDTPEDIVQKIPQVMPSAQEMDGAIFRLTMDYPRSLESMIDEPAIRLAAESALEFHLARKVRVETRSRLAEGAGISSMSAEEQLNVFWLASKVEEDDREALNLLARSIFSTANGMTDDVS
jgi:DNA repair protein SbcD/Mre11